MALVLVGLLAGGVVRFTVVVAGRAQAQAAADAAALAGASAGRAAAERAARANGARLVSWRVEDLEVHVVVARGEVGARASARWVIGGDAPGTDDAIP